LNAMIVFAARAVFVCRCCGERERPLLCANERHCCLCVWGAFVCCDAGESFSRFKNPEFSSLNGPRCPESLTNITYYSSDVIGSMLAMIIDLLEDVFMVKVVLLLF
jgi:hypothetical protein